MQKHLKKKSQNSYPFLKSYFERNWTHVTLQVLAFEFWHNQLWYIDDYVFDKSFFYLFSNVSIVITLIVMKLFYINKIKNKLYC